MRPNDYLDRQTSIKNTHRHRPLLKHSNPALESRRAHPCTLMVQWFFSWFEDICDDLSSIFVLRSTRHSVGEAYSKVGTHPTPTN